MCFVFSEGGELQAPAMFSALRRRRAVFCVLIRRRATSARHVFCSQKEESYSPPAMFSVLGRRRATSARRVFCSQEESCVLCSQKEESYKRVSGVCFLSSKGESYKCLQDLRDRAIELQQEIDESLRRGDVDGMQRKQRDLNDTEAQLLKQCKERRQRR